MEPLYVFCHVPRTASVSLMSHFDQLQPAERMRVYLGEKFKSREEIEDFFANLEENRKQQLRVIYGHHVYYDIAKCFPNRDVRFLTFLRHPTAQIISFYNNARQKYLDSGEVVPNGVVDEETNSILPFEDWFIFAENTRNFMSIFLTQEFLRQPFGSRSSLDELKVVLDCFYYVGIAETYEQDAKNILKTIGLTYTPTRINESRQRFAKTEEYDRLVTGVSRLDMELYNHAVKVNTRIKQTICG